jgi:hypothetical protein
VSSMMGFGSPFTPQPTAHDTTGRTVAEESTVQPVPETPITMRRYGEPDMAIANEDEPADIDRTGQQGGAEMRRTSSDTIAPLPLGKPLTSGKSTAAQDPEKVQAYRSGPGGPRTEQDVEQGITQLARQMSRQVSRSPTTGTGTGTAGQGAGRANVFDYESGSDLDPYSKTFDAKKWVRSLQAVAEEDEGTQRRTSGVAFKGMGVHGFGSDAGTSSPIHLACSVQSVSQDRHPRQCLGNNDACGCICLTDDQTTKRPCPTSFYPPPRPRATSSPTASAACRSYKASTAYWNLARCSSFSVRQARAARRISRLLPAR